VGLFLFCFGYTISVAPTLHLVDKGTLMKSVVLPAVNQSMTIVDSEPAVLNSGEARIQLYACAWNKRDHWITQGKYPGIKTPAVLGSDGCGLVIECPDHPEWVGKEVVLCPSLNWGPNPNHQSFRYSILGMPTNGTAAEEICISVDNLCVKPTHLTAVEGAAIPLAGLTAWRATVTKANVQSKDRVLVTGIGGGTAVFALQFAMALGADVWVSSSSKTKIDRAIELGAKGGVLYTEEDWGAQLQRLNPKGFDVIIDSAGGDGFGTLLKLLGMGGRLAFFGGTAGKWPRILPQYLFFKQVSILATTMGSPQEFQDMIGFIDEHSIQPIVDSTFEMQDCQYSMNRLTDPDRFGKVTLRLHHPKPTR